MAAQSPLPITASTTSAINRQVLTVTSELSVADVIHRMSSEGNKLKTSCALVVDSNEYVIGIVTERDIVGLTASQEHASQPFSEIPVSAVMTTPVKTLEIEAFQDIFAVLFLFRRYRIRHLPIVDATGKLFGVVTPTSIRTVLKPANLLKVRRVADIMTKGVIQASADSPVIFLAQLMAQHRVSCVVIMDTVVIEEDGEPAINPPIGIVTERDIVQFQAMNLDLHKLTARAVMSSPLFLLDPKDSLWAAHEAMQTHKVRRLVVSWNWGKGVGIITQTSLLRVFDPIEMYSIIGSLQQTIKQLSQDTEAEQTAALPSPKAPKEPSKELLKEIKTPLFFEQDATQGKNTAEPTASALELLAQATHCIQQATARPEFNASQQFQLQQALNLIQQAQGTL